MLTTSNIQSPRAFLNSSFLKPQNLQSQIDTATAYQNLAVTKLISQAKFPVYLAASKVNNQKYALKIFPYEKGQPHPYYLNESRFSRLKHPNVINALYCQNERHMIRKGELTKASYILMEYATYGDFFDFTIKHKQDFDEKLARTYFRQLINGIEFLHSCGVAHLDLKPENLLLGADFNLKIADFDLSYVRGDAKILSNGTRYYRGPEFFKSTSPGIGIKRPFAADIYGAGVILYILKSGGIYPHAENNDSERANLVDLLYSDNKEFWKKHCEIEQRKSSFYSKSFKELFNHMTSANPEERWSIQQIKKSKWYNGSVYSPANLQKKMKKILNVE